MTGTEVSDLGEQMQKISAAGGETEKYFCEMQKTGSVSGGNRGSKILPRLHLFERIFDRDNICQSGLDYRKVIRRSRNQLTQTADKNRIF